MLIFGALLRCASPVLTMAAAMGHGRQIFYSPPDKRQEAQVGTGHMQHKGEVLCPVCGAGVRALLESDTAEGIEGTMHRVRWYFSNTLLQEMCGSCLGVRCCCDVATAYF